MKNENLPTEWWLNSNACLRLRNYLKRHIVGLHIGFVQDGQQKDEFLSGFLVAHRGYCFWITAGHVAKLICQIREDKDITLDHAEWIDDESASMGGSVPVDINSLNPVSIDSKGQDLGVVLFSKGYALPILHNPGVEFLDSRIWEYDGMEAPDSYMLLGFPYEWFDVNRRTQSELGARRKITYGAACLPVKSLEDLGAEANEGSSQFWGSSSCFYGQLVDFENEDCPIVSDIRGMSGGPIFTVKTCADGIRYYLWGIQGCWLESKRFIRGIHAAAIPIVLDTIVDHLQAVRNGSGD